MELYAQDIRSGPSFRSIPRPRLSTWEAILAAWEPWAPLGCLGQSVHRSPWNWLALGSCMPTKLKREIFKDLDGYLTKLRQLTVDITVTGHSRCWGCKDGSQIWVKKVNACKMTKQINNNRNKDSVNPIPTPLKTQPNDDNDSTSKDRQIWGGQKSHLHMIYYKYREVRVRVQLDVSCLPPRDLPAHMII